MNRAVYLIACLRAHPWSLAHGRAAIQRLTQLLGDRGAAARLVADVRQAATARMVRGALRHPLRRYAPGPVPTQPKGD